MSKKDQRKPRYRIRFLALFALITVAAVAIAILSMNIARDLRLLNSADSDNVQWSLTQAEVEFLEYYIELSRLVADPTLDLALMRRKFDIFYSRIATLSQSQIYEELRSDERFSSNLQKSKAFLDTSLPIIDAIDSTLLASLPKLVSEADALRPFVRTLANSGLVHFAREADNRRQRLASTMGQLAVSVATLAIALLALAVYLGVLAQRNANAIKMVNRASARMKVITSTSLDGVIVTDTSGLILEFNAAAESIFGYSQEYAMGKDFGELIVPEKFKAAHAAGMRRMRESGEKRVVGKGRVQLEGQHADGHTFPVELAIQSATTRDGEIFIAFLRDISQQVKSDEELIEARDRALEGERAKASFLATMSHEIRTPLNGLLGNLTLIKSTKLTSKQEIYVQNMEASGSLLMNHISDVLDILSYDAGKLQTRLAPLNPSALLEEIVNSQVGAAMAQGTVLEWGWVGEPVGWINSDHRKLQHILVNLIGNAIKFTYNGRVDIEAMLTESESGAQEIAISVRDTGVGISPDQIDLIFDDFVTGNAAYNRDVGGTGLGLGIAKRFVAALEGTISVESTPEVGSTFTVRIPAEIVDESTEEVLTKADVPTTVALDLLLVEDNEINRFVATEMLTRCGHSVTEAENGKIGVELASAHKFDLILMDISMPVMDGREATRAIRVGNGASCKAPIVALTANALVHEQEAFLEDGMNDVITKPLTPDALALIANKWGEQMVLPDTLISKGHFTEMREMIGREQHDRLLNRLDAEISDLIVVHLDAIGLDLAELAAVAHKISGSAATLGGKDVAELLNALETAAKAEDSSEVQRLATKLPALWKQTRHEFDALR